VTDFKSPSAVWSFHHGAVKL